MSNTDGVIRAIQFSDLNKKNRELLTGIYKTMLTEQSIMQELKDYSLYPAIAKAMATQIAHFELEDPTSKRIAEGYTAYAQYLTVDPTNECPPMNVFKKLVIHFKEQIQMKD